MSKQLRTLLIAGITVVVLVALLLVMLFTGLLGDNSKKATDSTDSDSKTITLLDKSTDNGKAVANPVSRMHLVTTKLDYALALTTDKVMTVEGWEKIPANAEATSSLVEALTTITAEEEISKSAPDVSAYGFDKPTATLTVTYFDGAIKTFEIGNETPSTGAYYFREQSSNAIYTVDAEFVSKILVPSTNYVDKTIITAPSVHSDDSTGKAVVRNVRLTGTSRSQEIYIREANESDPDLYVYTGFVMLKPYYGGCNTTTDCVVSKMATYTSATADDVACVNPTAAQLEQYGLTNPFSVLTLSLGVQSSATDANNKTTYTYYNNKTYTVSLGNKNDAGNYYASVKEDGSTVPVIYLLSSTTAPWAESTYNDFASPLLFLENITDIDTMAITANKETNVFQLKHNALAEEDDNKLTVTIKDTKYSTSDFRNLYSVILGIKRNDVAPAAPTGTPAVTIRMTHVDTAVAPTEIQLYNYSSSVYIAKYSNGDTCAVLAKNVNHALTQLDNYLNGKTVITY